MTSRRSSRVSPDVVTLATQDESDRLAMIVMQLDMALALARDKGFVDVVTYLESALDEARRVHRTWLN
ncbi:hypothetical protein IMCC20628_02365 [Hoeflea sp. IMCC20628]|uniref:hypothetical protein n=1 Tax=Hoeflea sp. IMCC20628 TaxID=1620421 RepID=UPI00063AB885|nr:hypothetical protein [Hoeflea sp. IMCC20628]AKI01063.1 hypothetical protein IMCC20628_02365 [Hoeflea sp. IMCC20628]